jgi:hypothetical protein
MAQEIENTLRVVSLQLESGMEQMLKTWRNFKK